MVKQCVAAGFSNMYSDGVSFFLFPKDHAKSSRIGLSGRGPLCSDHFSQIL